MLLSIFLPGRQLLIAAFGCWLHAGWLAGSCAGWLAGLLSPVSALSLSLSLYIKQKPSLLLSLFTAWEI